MENNPPLTTRQRKTAMFLYLTGDSAMLNGVAGSGKTHLLKCMKKLFHHDNTLFVTCAPTGLAADNVHGSTFHSQFGFNSGIQDTDIHIDLKRPYNKALYDLIRNLVVLFIDEVSMVRSDILCMLDQMFREIRNCPLPFGGVKLIMFGDLMQLPPVAKTCPNKDQTPSDSELIHYKYHTLKGFLTDPVRNLPHDYLELNEHLRQADPLQWKLLDRIRTGNVDQECVDQLNNIVFKPLPSTFNGIYLTAINDDADKINQEQLSQLDPATERVYEVEPEYQPYLKQYHLDEKLTLRIGARVMFLQNGLFWRNGTTGIVKKLLPEEIIVEIGDREYSVGRATFSEYVTEVKNGMLIQTETNKVEHFPLCLAWAITIHKAQGQTYSKDVCIQMKSRAFQPGLTYVALSRATNLNNVYATRPFGLDDFLVDQETLRYMREESEREKNLGFLEPALDRMELFYCLIKYLKDNQVIHAGDKILIHGNGASLLAALMAKNLHNCVRIMYVDESTAFCNAAEKYCQKYSVTSVEAYNPEWCQDERFNTIIELDTLANIDGHAGSCDENSVIRQIIEAMVDNGTLVIVNSDKINDWEQRYKQFVMAARKQGFTSPKFPKIIETEIESLTNNYSFSVLNRTNIVSLSTVPEAVDAYAKDFL